MDWYLHHFQLLGKITAILVALGIFLSLAKHWVLRRFIRYFVIRPLPQDQETNTLHLSLERLARRAYVSQPQLYLLEDFSPNALALHRGKKPMIIVTQGLLQSLSQEELDAVLCLCLAQLKLRDFRSSLAAVFFALPITLFSKKLPMSISLLFQALAMIFIRIFVRRDRMYRADQYAAQIIQDPSLIARTLRKLTTLTRKIPLERQNIAVDHLFVVSSIRDELVAAACTTHPQPEERIRRLLQVSIPC